MYFWNSVLKPTKPTIVYSENRVLCSVNLSKQGYPNSFPALKKLLTSHPEFPSTSRHENSSLILWRFFLHFYSWANCTKTEISVDYSVISCWTIAFSSLSLKFRFMHFWVQILIFWQKKSYLNCTYNHGVWKSQKKSHLTLRAKRATSTLIEWTKID